MLPLPGRDPGVCPRLSRARVEWNLHICPSEISTRKGFVMKTNRGMGVQNSGHPEVKQRGMPPDRGPPRNPGRGVAPNSGNTARGGQSGSTGKATDGGGGVGNTADHLHNYLKSK